MLLFEIFRAVLKGLRKQVVEVVNDARVRERLVKNQPSLRYTLGEHLTVDLVSTIGSNIYIGSNTRILTSSISNHTRIWGDAVIESSALGNSVILGQKCAINNSKLNNYVTIGDFSTVGYSSIESYTYLGKSCWISQTSIGKFCSIAQNLSCGTGNHPTHLSSTSPLFYSTQRNCEITFSSDDFYNGHSATIIGNDVWIGANVFIKSGLKVGNGAILAAGAVVMKDVAAYSIVGGVPAREIRKRYSQEDIDVLENIAWWDWTEDELREAAPIIREGTVKDLKVWWESRNKS